MDKGHIVRRLENEAAPQIIAFDRYAVDINSCSLNVRSTRAAELRNGIIQAWAVPVTHRF
jgi:hypothetical protein